MNKYKPTLSEVAVKSGLAGKDTAEKEARLDVCKIAHGQDQGHAGCGVLVYDQKVDDHELSKHCIITITEVVNSIENKIFEKDEYKVTFRHKNKQFDLRNVTKVVRSASGLVLIFINSSCKELKKCSILRESRLSIATPDHSSKSSLFCFIENQRYNVVESTGENGEVVYDLEPDSKTATSASDSPKEIPHGTVILQYDAHDDSLMAVGIFKVVDKKHMKISPIWFKSSLNDVLACSTVQTDGKPQTQTTSGSGSSGDTPDKLGLQMNIENVPNSQEVLNAIASRYLQSVRPSNSEEFNDFKQYITEVDKKLIVGIQQGRLIITMRCSSFQILEQLWEDYCSGHLNEMGQKCLVTEEILREFGLKEAKLTTTIPKREYRTCEQYFMGLLGVSEQFISKAVTENTLLLERLSKYLDRESRIINCWRHLASDLNVPPEQRRKFDRCTEHSPTEDLFFHLADVNPDLTVGDLKTKLKDIYRNDVIARLDKVSDLVSKVVVEGSELLAEIGEHLNHEMRARKNWRDLAYKLRISPEVSKTFDTSTETSKSPTRMMFEWLQSSKPNLTVRDLVNGLENIRRYDVVDVVRKDVAIALEKTKKQKDDSTQGYCTAH